MWTLQDAKNRFSSLVDAAMAGQPQEVTRRGKPAVVIVSAAEYDRLLAEAGGHRGRFADHILAFPGDAIERAEARPRDVEF
ncbi:type II toxin-antitoxin system Phd/YefM family antitoxin [Amaricoccus tamworthensis]|uniref:type II toxin-antitoxin system Phd/YefM family antitoxin n=1 Tax=Amaricoccus tamworthensis TaxID=57002 RepID=UPI003C7A0355